MNGRIVFAPRISWGSLLPAVGYSRCWRCRRPWWCATEHTVYVAPDRGYFALCERCWRRSPMHRRVAAHLHVALRTGMPAEVRDAVVRAVKAPDDPLGAMDLHSADFRFAQGSSFDEDARAFRAIVRYRMGKP